MSNYSYGSLLEAIKFIEQLQAELKSKDAEIQQFVDHAEQRTREIERYRAALEKINDPLEGGWQYEVAREALGEME